MNVSKRSPVTELQIMACVFGSIYAFHLISEDLAVCPFSGGFLHDLPFRRYKALKSPTLFSKFRWRCEQGCQCFSLFSHKR